MNSASGLETAADADTDTPLEPKALRSKHFRRFFIAATISNIGAWMQSVAIPFAIYEITKSEAWLGATAFASMSVGAIANTPGGVAADRYSRRKVMAITQVIQMASALGLWLLFGLGKPTLPLMIGLMMIGSIGAGLTMPVWQSLVPFLAPKEALADAIRLNSMQFAIARAIGPALGALVLKTFGPTTCFAVNALTYPIVIGVLLMLPASTRKKNERLPLSIKQVSADVVDGWRHVLSSPVLRLPPMSAGVNAAFGFGLTTLAPAFAAVMFARSSDDNGPIVGAFGLGGVIGSFLAQALSKKLKQSTQLKFSLLLWIASAIALAPLRSFVVGLVVFVIMGIANSTLAITLNTILQSRLDERYRGRVMGNYTQMFFLGSAVGSLILGLVAEWFGLRAAPLWSAAWFGAYLAYLYVRYDKLRLVD